VALWETNAHRRRQDSACALVENEMGVKARDIRRGARGSHTGDWELLRDGRVVAVAEYKFRHYVPSGPSWCWQVDIAKVVAVRDHAIKLGAVPLFIVESYSLKDFFKCGMRCTFNCVVGTVLKPCYPISSMTLNRPREAADRDDPVYNIPDGDMSSLSVLAWKLWGEEDRGVR
jgi:hypothetical protein